MKKLSIILLILLWSTFSFGTTYYVDMTSGNNSNNCTACQTSSTPKATVQHLLDNCALAPGDTVKIKGTTTSAGFTVTGSDDGSAIHTLETVSSLNGSTVTFSTTPSGVSTSTDYVMIYNSLKGNSGAFKVTGVVGANITVDTSRLPGGTFLSESSSDTRPSGLTVIQGIIIRPVSFEAWDDSNIPIWSNWGADDKIIYIGTSGSPAHYVRFYKLKYTETSDRGHWCFFQYQYGSQYGIVDSVEQQGGRGFWFTEFGPNHSNTNRHIVQYCNLTDWSHNDAGVNSSEAFYIGNDPAGGTPGSGFNYMQIMYNRIQGRTTTVHVNQNNAIDVKSTANNTTLWGNEIYNVYVTDYSGEVVSLPGPSTVFANNYIHDIYIVPSGDSAGMVNLSSDGPLYIFNNILSTGNGTIDGFHADAYWGPISNINVFNNVVYNLGAGSAGFATQSNPSNYAITGNIKNNIFLNTGTYGIRFEGSGTKPTTSYNIANGYSSAAWSNITCSSCLTSNPQLTNPASGDFTIGTGSPCYNTGTDLSSYFTVDNHDAASPTIFGTWPALAITQPQTRSGTWDIGVYEYVGPSIVRGLIIQ